MQFGYCAGESTLPCAIAPGNGIGTAELFAGERTEGASSFVHFAQLVQTGIAIQASEPLLAELQRQQKQRSYISGILPEFFVRGQSEGV
ncbi:hypothetical protein J2802_005539 [Paraburkholderia caribensis]|nr:hypothetical protein [Paraburkholderia caribensis]